MDIYGGLCGQMKTMRSDSTDTLGNSVSSTTDMWSDTRAGVSRFTARVINVL